MFDKLPYNSKIRVCEIFYLETLNVKLDFLLPKKIYFSWNKIIIETDSGEITFKIVEVENWYIKNLKSIRKEKLLSITKREMVVN